MVQVDVGVIVGVGVAVAGGAVAVESGVGVGGDCEALLSESGSKRWSKDATHFAEPPM